MKSQQHLTRSDSKWKSCSNSTGFFCVLANIGGTVIRVHFFALAALLGQGSVVGFLLSQEIRHTALSSRCKAQLCLSSTLSLSPLNHHISSSSLHRPFFFSSLFNFNISGFRREKKSPFYNFKISVHNNSLPTYFNQEQTKPCTLYSTMSEIAILQQNSPV